MCETRPSLPSSAQRWLFENITVKKGPECTLWLTKYYLNISAEIWWPRSTCVWKSGRNPLYVLTKCLLTITTEILLFNIIRGFKPMFETDDETYDDIGFKYKLHI